MLAQAYPRVGARNTSRTLFLFFVVVGVAIRLAIAWIPGNSVLTPWSGGGDMYAYLLLADNIVTGKGYTYASIPTAFRTPGYPLFLAGTMELFGKHFLLAARFLQATAGIVAAYRCMRAARLLFGKTAGNIALIGALLSPTLAYFSGEILTEGLASFFVASFLWALAEDTKQPNWKTAIAMGLTIGLGAMVRANTAVLGLVALLGAWTARPARYAKRELLMIPISAAIIVAPWVIRNSLVFGRPLLSTEAGSAALVSLVNPEARLVAGWDSPLRELVGYVVPNQLETNDDERRAIGSELDMNRKCWEASGRLWDRMSLGAKFRWVLGKWQAYWFSTDQLLHPGAVSRRNRGLHVAGVLFYWGFLVLAGIGCWNLRKSRPTVVLVLIAYAVLVTAVHTPFVMNSRIRAPLVDPLIAVLGGGGAAALVYGTKGTITLETSDSFLGLQQPSS